MQYPARDLRSGLSSKGFEITDAKDEYYANFIFCGKLITSIKSWVGGHSKQKYKDLQDPILSRIQKALHFDTKKELIKFVKCDTTKEEYEAMLIEKGLVELPPKTDCNTLRPRP